MTLVDPSVVNDSIIEFIGVMSMILAGIVLSKVWGRKSKKKSWEELR